MKYLISLTALLFTSLLLSAQDRPNFVWVISEDNSKHFIKLFEENGIETPNIESLAKDGVIFDYACSNAPVCSTARTTLLTGCYGPRIGAQYHRKQQAVPMPDGLKPFPYYLKEAGYHTSNQGKTDYNVAIDFNTPWNTKGDWKKRKDDQPFFHQLSAIFNSHEGKSHFKANGMNKSNVKELADKVVIPPHHPDTPVMRYSYAHYLLKMQTIDQEVGKLIKRLKQDGVYDNTIIFYFGDHGGILPRSKGYAYETGLNPPLVIRFPDKWKHLVPFEKGTRTRATVNFMDFGPSLIHAAGVPVNENFDGKPFLGKGVTAEQLEARTAHGFADRFDEKYDLVRTLRKGKIKYMRHYQPFNQDALHSFYRYKSLAYLDLRKMYYDGKLNDKQSLFFQKKPPEALYDLEKDPYEVNNLAADPAYQKTLVAMRTELTAFLKEKNDLSFVPESTLIESAFKNPVAFGKKHSDDIASLIDIADLQLLPYQKAAPEIKKALTGSQALERYWGLISATYFAQKGERDSALTQAVNDLLDDNQETLLNRVRAAEYLAHIGEGKRAVNIITEAAYDSKDPVETNLILNSAAMIYETDRDKNRFDLEKGKIKTKSSLINERLKYLGSH